MKTNPVRKSSTASKTQSTAKHLPPGAAGASSMTRIGPQKTASMQDLIAEKAYQIWLSQGKQPDSEQRNWLEAELQLKSYQTRLTL